MLRGLHYQIRQPQGKLVRVTAGEIYDVAVDIRRSSPTFGKWTAAVLSARNRKMCWVPPGFAHGFLVMSDHAEVQYKTTDYWAPQHERCILWNDPDLAISLAAQGRANLVPEGPGRPAAKAGRGIPVTRILVRAAPDRSAGSCKARWRRSAR